MTFTLSSTYVSCTMQRTIQPQRWRKGACHLLLRAAEAEVAAPRAADAAAATTAEQPAEQTACAAAAAAAKWRCQYNACSICLRISGTHCSPRPALAVSCTRTEAVHLHEHAEDARRLASTAASMAWPTSLASIFRRPCWSPCTMSTVDPLQKPGTRCCVSGANCNVNYMPCIAEMPAGDCTTWEC
jgi:hypothetical protein